MAGRFSLRALAFLQAMLLLATLLLPALAAAATIQTDLFVYQDGDTVRRKPGEPAPRSPDSDAHRFPIRAGGPTSWWT